MSVVAAWDTLQLTKKLKRQVVFIFILVEIVINSDDSVEFVRWLASGWWAICLVVVQVLIVAIVWLFQLLAKRYGVVGQCHRHPDLAIVERWARISVEKPTVLSKRVKTNIFPAWSPSTTRETAISSW